MAKKRKDDFRIFEEDPFESLNKIQENIFRAMNNLWRRTSGVESQFPVDVMDKDKQIVVRANLPGIDKKNVSIKTTEDALEIKAEQSKEKKEEEGNYFRRERSYGSFYRAIALPKKVEPDKTKAKMTDGILEITLPKKEAEKEKKKKEVKIQ